MSDYKLAYANAGTAAIMASLSSVSLDKWALIAGYCAAIVTAVCSVIKHRKAKRTRAVRRRQSSTAVLPLKPEAKGGEK